MTDSISFVAFEKDAIRDISPIDTDRLTSEVDEIGEERLRSEETESLVDEIMKGETLTTPTVATEQASRKKKSDPPNATVEVEVPANGDVELLQHPLYPVSDSDKQFECQYDGDTLSFVVDVGKNTSPDVEDEISNKLRQLSFHSEEMDEDVETKNNSAQRSVRRRINRRKEEIKSEDEKLDEILDGGNK